MKLTKTLSSLPLSLSLCVFAVAVAVCAQPALIVWGDQDEILPKEDKNKFLEAIQNSRLRVVPECGHVPHLEKAAETAYHLTEFLLM